MAKSNLNFGKAKPGYDAKTVSEVFDELLSAYETAEKAHRDLEAQIITLQAELTDVQNQVSRNVSPNYSALGNAFEQVLSEAEKVDRNLRSNAASKSKQDLQNARSLAEQTLLEARRTVASLQANSQADVETLRVDTERKISELNGQTENIDRSAAAELEQAERSSSRAITEAEVEVAQFTQELHKELEQVRNELLELRAKHQYENLQALYELKVNEEVQGHARLERSEAASEAFRAASDAANAKIAAGVDQARASQQNAEQYLKDRRAEAAELLQTTRDQSAEMLREAFSLADTLINRAEEISRSVPISSESVNAELVKQIGLIQDLKNEIKSFATPEAIVSIEESNAHDKVTTDKQLAEV